MAKCASEVRTLLPCPMCGRALVPAPADSSLTFHCKSGHEISLGGLLQARSSAVKGGLELLLAEWAGQHQTLIDTVEHARKNGYLEVAEIFNRHAISLESRIRKVRDAFFQNDSTKLLKLPDIIRSA
jgi:hypothetical protein